MYLQLNTNQAVFGGNITLNTGNIQFSKFKVTQAVTNLANVFPSNTTANVVTIANNVCCSCGTMVLGISCVASAPLGGLKTLTFRYKDGAGKFRATITASFYFNQTNGHQEWPMSHRFTGIPANNMLISVQRNNETLICDNNDFITIVIDYRRAIGEMHPTAFFS
jgi:hypothetical protein